MGDAEFDLAPHLVDATKMRLDRLIATHDDILVNALARLLAELDEPREIIAAFDSYAGPVSLPENPD